MKTNTPFYVGWLPKEMPRRIKKFLLLIFLLALVGIIGLAYILVSQEKKFNNYVFEYGKIKTISGVFIPKPYPMIIMNETMFPNFSNTILLVGSGKFGAEKTITQLQNLYGNFDYKNIKLNGTLIYGDGKIIMELTNQDKTDLKILSKENFINKNNDLTLVNLFGEILDPKCYFGVMKPGIGKIHKSCAIRCISGGIPPVFRTKNIFTKQWEYFLLVDDNEMPIGKKILPFVGEKINLTGYQSVFYHWKFIKVKSIHY